MTARLVVAAPIAPMHLEPRVSSPQTSQLLAGFAVDIITRDGDWNHARGDDGYAGWIHRGYLAEEVTPTTLTSLGCVIEDDAGHRRPLPLGARIAAGMRLVHGEVLDDGDRAARFPAKPAAIVDSAVRLFEGTSYQWGGVTPWGADCSGMTQSVLRLHGIPLPRDAWQQAERGDAAEVTLKSAREGDLLFFSDREDHRITHVGVSAGGGRMVHVGLGRGGWAIESFENAADGYARALEERFRFARRLS